MPITDYEKDAEREKKKILADPKISEINKQHFLDRLKVYKVSDATLSIFNTNIPEILRRTKDLKKEMQDRKKINNIFAEIDQKYKNKNARYDQIVKVSVALATWLNDGDKPIGFKDIKKRSEKKQQRKLRTEDMITWEDGQAMSNKTTSVQIKAIVLTQLDGGFRPSEFIDMKYGDVRKEGKYFIASVDGKTGARSVILWKCIPYLQRWLQMHPTKEKTDPLWIMENIRKSSKEKENEDIVKYPYPAIAKRIRELGEKARIKKPMDFYNFRHSSAYQKKLDNWPLDEAARNMGHSVKFFTEVYGRLSIKDNMQRVDLVYGLTSEKVDVKRDNPVVCTVCDYSNKPKKELCEKCGNPLTLRKAMDMRSKERDEIALMVIKQISGDAIQKQVKDLLKDFSDRPGMLKDALKELES